MQRFRAFAYSAFVALAVFFYLALPTLAEIFGPVVTLPVYALLAVLAGRITWILLADDTELSADDTPATQNLASDDLPETDPDVDDELTTLREDS